MQISCGLFSRKSDFTTEEQVIEQFRLRYRMLTITYYTYYILLFPVAKLPDRSRKHTRRQCCGSGSAGSVCFWASFYHQARIMRNTLISTVLWLLFDFLSFLLNPISCNFYDFSQKSVFLYVKACSGLPGRNKSSKSQQFVSTFWK